MQCCNSFATERILPPTHIDLEFLPLDFVKHKKCHIDKLFTQNEQMCNQTALLCNTTTNNTLSFT